MSSAFESIQKGLMEAIEFAEGNTKAATVHKFDAVDVKEVRHNVIDASYSSNYSLAPYPK